ncbi:MAG: prephenate dehydrogenase [Chitinophagaceae bacterium]|nr:MAG: prephenate dehydrogenase [Chitinophagaceae bacterium]
MKIAIIGVGLIGGSMAMALRQKMPGVHLIGVDASDANCDTALQLGLVNSICNLEEAVQQSELVILAVPVDASLNLLPQILKIVTTQVVMDVGSTKDAIAALVAGLPKAGRFVATHPMWGTEYSGPAAAVKGAFLGKAVVICNRQTADADALAAVENIYRLLGMHILYMDAPSHDVHAAYISHISHITSFALANTVLEKERQDDTIFELASGGFESTVRLAKSSAAMWVPIFMQNKENVLDVLNEHISQLKKFKSCLEKENETYLAELIEHANSIRRIIK